MQPHSIDVPPSAFQFDEPAITIQTSFVKHAFPPLPPTVEQIRTVQKATFVKKRSWEALSILNKSSDVQHVTCVPSELIDSGALMALELCAGSAGITQALGKLGFIAQGVDHQRNRHMPKAACAKIDLASLEGQSLLNDFLCAAVVFFTWLGPPCGTCSRAREIPLTQKQILAGAPRPVPLRSAEHPRGFPWLEGINRTKVELANRIYDYCSDYIDKCLSEGRLFCIENPRGSWLWHLPRFQQLLQDKRIYIVDFQACMYKGDRPKWTRLVTNCKEFLALAKTCDNSHTHAEWGVSQQSTGSWKFNTADEAEYTSVFCKAVATKVAQAAVRMGHIRYDEILQSDMADVPANKRNKVAAAVQPRGAAVPPIVSEYRCIEAVVIPAAMFSSLLCGKSLPLSLSTGDNKILRLEKQGGDAGPNCVFTAIVGFYRTPQEFVAEAAKAQHPFDCVCNVPDVTRHNVFFILTQGKVAVTKFRLSAIQDVKKVVQECEAEDAAILSALPAEIQRVLVNKKFASLKRLLLKYSYVDSKIADELPKGLSYTGTPAPSGIFKSDFRLPSLSESELRNSSRWVRAATLASISSSGDAGLDRAVWEETVAERDRGWLQGPYTQPELDAMFPAGWCAARRFGLMQSGKLRCIDDLSEPGTNAAFGTSEKLSLMGLDSIAGLVRFVHSAVQDNREVHVTLSDNSVLRGKLHPEWTVEEARTWYGRCLDLRKAYRQLVSDPQSRWNSVVCLYNPETNGVSCFVAIAALFGGAAVVYKFNRAARSLWFLLANHLKICWCNYYDDFPMLEPSATARGSQISVEACLKLLGWDYADEGNKCLKFDSVFASLGAVFDLSKMGKGQAFITNKDDRISAIQTIIKDLQRLAKMTSGEAASIKGKLQYAEAQCYGRIAGRCMRLLGEVASGKKKGTPLDRDTTGALTWLLERLTSAKPRPLIPDNNRDVILVFTDAASEGELHTCGGVFIDKHTSTKEYFSFEINPVLISEWRSPGIVQIITHAEIYPVWIARASWGERFRRRRVFFFVDNNGAKDSLVKGVIHSSMGDAMLQAILLLEFDQHSHSWYTRVPSPSNFSDKPSRLDCSELEADESFVRIHPRQPDSFAKGIGEYLPI